MGRVNIHAQATEKPEELSVRVTDTSLARQAFAMGKALRYARAGRASTVFAAAICEHLSVEAAARHQALSQWPHIV